jgi:serine/threonine protein phosphatase PrpC
MVSPEPDVVERRLNENDEFLILACDGMFEESLGESSGDSSAFADTDFH